MTGGDSHEAGTDRGATSAAKIDEGRVGGMPTRTSGDDPTQPNPGSSPGRPSSAASVTPHRDLVHAAEEAAEAMHRYAELLMRWNAPDDEHTRFQLRSVADTVIEEVGLRV